MFIITINYYHVKIFINYRGFVTELFIRVFGFGVLNVFGCLNTGIQNLKNVWVLITIITVIIG